MELIAGPVKPAPPQHHPLRATKRRMYSTSYTHQISKMHINGWWANRERAKGLATTLGEQLLDAFSHAAGDEYAYEPRQIASLRCFLCITPLLSVAGHGGATRVRWSKRATG